MHSFDWDDLRFALALARTGSLSGASRALSVNHTTVLRRIAGLEARCGVRLFERVHGRYAPTAAGQEVAERAALMADLAVEVERRVIGRDVSLSGRLRIATTDTLMASVLPDALAKFRSVHPQIELEIAVSNEHAALNRREADVAIRPAAAPDEATFGRRVSALAFTLYAHPAILPELASRALHDWPWVGLDDALRGTTAARWLRRSVPAAKPGVTADSLLAARDLVAAQLGVAMLPCYLGDVSTDLTRVPGQEPPRPMNELWVAAHEDLKRNARVRAFMGEIADALTERRPLFQGAELRGRAADQAPNSGFD